MNTQEFLNLKNARTGFYVFCESHPAGRSAWSRGVHAYALELAEAAEAATDYHPGTLRELLLNGASNWNEYSYGGSALIYDSDIAERVCTPSEFKRFTGGQPSGETWLDLQARALQQAERRVIRWVKDWKN